MLRNGCFLLVASCLISGCDEHRSYVGDGTFVDRGAADANRYEVNFGRLSLEQEYTFSVTTIPAERFVFGVRTTSQALLSTSEALDKCVVSIKIADGTMQQIVNRSERLSGWIKSTDNRGEEAFFYLREPRGTYANLRSDTRYAVTVRVTGVDVCSNALDLVAMGGGWK